MSKLTKQALATLFLSTLALSTGVTSAQADEVNVYSARQENLIKPILDQFTEETGIRVNLVTGGADELITRLQREGRNSPADVLLTVDVGRLYRAEELELLQPIKSALLAERIPRQYRDSDNHWFAVSLRSRVIVYNKERVKPEQLSSYEALANPEWKGRVCVRSSSNIYNQSMVAAMIDYNGVEATEAWAKGLVANFGRSPQGGDRDQISAVAVGQCDVALVNTYYLAGMLTAELDEQRAIAEQVALFWPNQDGRGSHINISGAGVTRHARNRDHAVKLLEFMVSDQSQAWYAQANSEFPVRSGIAISDVLKSWGNFKADTIPLEKLGVYNAEAVRLMDRAGWR